MRSRVRGSKLRPWWWALPKTFFGWKNVPLHTFCPCFRSKSHVPMMKTFPKLSDRSSEMLTSAMKPFLLAEPSAEKAHLRHEGGFYSVPSCFCHFYSVGRCRGNRVSFDHVFRNVLTINIHAAHTSHCRLETCAMIIMKLPTQRPEEIISTSSLVIWLYSKGAGPRQDAWTEKRIQIFDVWKTLVWGYTTVPKTCFLQQSTRKGVR